MTPKKVKKAFLLVLLVFILLTPVFSVLRMNKTAQEVQYYEQRNPASLPMPTVTSLLNGSFFTDFEAAVTDRLATRTAAIRSYFGLNMALQRPAVDDSIVNAEVMLGKNSYNRWDNANLYPQAEEIAADYAALKDYVEARGGYFCYVGVPLQTFYYTDLYPSYMENREWHLTTLRDAFATAMEGAGVPFVEMNEIFRSREWEEKLYPETDHHYTYYGAYVTAQALAERIREDTAWDVHIPTRNELHWQELPNAFLGSSNRKLYGLWDSTDRAAIAEPKEEIPFRRFDNGEEVTAEVFDLPSTETEDVTYSLYMGGDVAETIIRTEREELPDVLVVGDSFTNSLETLLYMGFDEMRSLDYRHYNGLSLREYIAQYQPDIVICVRDESTYFSREMNGRTD